MNALLNTINLDQATDITQETQGGNFENYLTKEGAAGKCLLRFVGYVEIGEHLKKNSFGEKVVPQAQLTFDVVTPRHVETYTHDGVEKTNVRQLRITVNISQSPKGMYVKFFKAMNWTQKHKHFAEMLGQGFMADLTVTADPKGALWPNIHDPKEGICSIVAPVKEDPMEGTKINIPVPEAKSDIQMFLWDQPNQPCWDSIFIDGTYKKKDDDTEYSKNFTQNKILEALNYSGSPLEAMLSGVDAAIDDLGSVEQPSAEVDDLLAGL